MNRKQLRQQIEAFDELCNDISSSHDFSDDPWAQDLIWKADDAIEEMRRVLKENKDIESKEVADAYSKMLHCTYYVEVYFRGEAK